MTKPRKPLEWVVVTDEPRDPEEEAVIEHLLDAMDAAGRIADTYYFYVGGVSENDGVS